MEQLPQVGFMKSFVLFWKNYVNFKGRSRRSEYWYMMLWHLIFILPASSCSLWEQYLWV